MNRTLSVCFVIVIVQIYSYSASSVTNYKAINKRLVNGSPMNNFDTHWFFTATLDIFHYSNGTWLRHPVCLGSFLQVGESYMVVTAANCFFPPGYNHTEFSYMSKNNYRVFLGVVRIRYGTGSYSNLNRFGLRSTVTHPIVIIHPEWPYDHSTEYTNIAILPISSKCFAKLNEGVTKRLISALPQYLNLPESDELVGDYCAVVGWQTDLVPVEDVFAPHKDHSNLLLGIGKFLALNSSSCNRCFTNHNISKRLAGPRFCISGNYGDCVDVYLSPYEYGSGVVCNGLWSGFVSAIFNVDAQAKAVPNVAANLQFATITTVSQIRRFIDAAHLSDGSHTCVLSRSSPSDISAGDKKVFNPILAKDYASP